MALSYRPKSNPRESWQNQDKWYRRLARSNLTLSRMDSFENELFFLAKWNKYAPCSNFLRNRPLVHIQSSYYIADMPNSWSWKDHIDVSEAQLSR